VENVSTFAVPIKTGNIKKSLSAMLECYKTERFTTGQPEENISCTVRESATFFKEISIEV